MLDVDVLHTGGRYAEWVLEYLRSRPGEVRDYQVIGALPIPIDDAREVLPPEAGSAAVVVSMGAHQDILADLPAIMAERGGRALIACSENPEWLRPGILPQISEKCRARGIECALPKPFCNLEPQGDVLREFCEQFGVGRPQLRLELDDGTVKRAECVRGSPCGLTEWVAERLAGRPADESLVEAAKVLHHTRPCLASMAMDPRLGETVMHLSFYLMEAAVEEALRKAREDS
jgi:hypothetical protein